MNIANIRLLLILALAPFAAMAGFAISPAPVTDAVTAGETSDASIAPIVAADLALLVERLGNTGLFPASIPLQQTVTDDSTTAQADEADLVDLEEELGEGAPRIRALVAYDGQWRVLARFSDGRIESLQADDHIYDGWRILAIGPNGIEIASDVEQRSINVFLTQDI